MSKVVRVSLWISILMAALFLSGGLALIGSWLGIFAITLLLICWVIMRRFSWPSLIFMLLVGYIAAAAGGTLLGTLPSLMIVGSTFAFAAWELANQNSQAKEVSPLPQNIIWQKNTLLLLFTSTGLGLFGAEVLLLVQIHIPFGWLIFFGLLVVFGLFMFFRLMKNENV